MVLPALFFACRDGHKNHKWLDRLFQFLPLRLNLQYEIKQAQLPFSFALRQRSGHYIRFCQSTLYFSNLNLNTIIIFQ